MTLNEIANVCIHNIRNSELNGATRADQMRYIFDYCAENGCTPQQMRAVTRDALRYDNMGAIYNVWKKWNDARNGATTTPTQPTAQPTAQPVAVDYNAFTFGVEFEGGFKGEGTLADLIASARRRGLTVVDISTRADHADRLDAWKAVRDSSLTGLRNMCEIVSPVLQGENGWYQLLTMCEVFAQVGFTVNKSCGTHVHIGCISEAWSTIANVVVTYHNAQEAYDSIVAPSRRGVVHWCKPYSCQELACIANSTCPEDVFEGRGVCADARQCTYPSSRYHAVNLVNMAKPRKTVEFRQHGGTVDFEKISRWIQDKMELITWCRSNRLTEPVNDVRTAPWMSAGTRLYFTARAMWFAR